MAAHGFELFRIVDFTHASLTDTPDDPVIPDVGRRGRVWIHVPKGERVAKCGFVLPVGHWAISESILPRHEDNPKRIL